MLVPHTGIRSDSFSLRTWCAGLVIGMAIATVVHGDGTVPASASASCQAGCCDNAVCDDAGCADVLGEITASWVPDGGCGSGMYMISLVFQPACAANNCQLKIGSAADACGDGVSATCITQQQLDDLFSECSLKVGVQCETAFGDAKAECCLKDPTPPDGVPALSLGGIVLMGLVVVVGGGVVVARRARPRISG